LIDRLATEAKNTNEPNYRGWVRMTSFRQIEANRTRSPFPRCDQPRLRLQPGDFGGAIRLKG